MPKPNKPGSATAADQPRAQATTQDALLDSPMAVPVEREEITDAFLAASDPPIGQPAPTTGLTFGDALVALREGRRVRRAAWLHPAYHVYIDPRYPGRLTYMYDKAALTDEDLLAGDWIVL